jgi:hypothetical protein
MPDDDQRDPLDSWLDQQVRPLPPPSGTFELITRRARRRKLRKLAVGAVSAVATPPLLSLRVTPSQAQAGRVDSGRSAPGSAGGTQQQTGHGSKVTPTPAGSPGSATAAPAPVPPNFQPASVTFVDVSTGWVIGQAGTPGKCANSDPYVCTSIARTDDAGKTWEGGPAPDATGPSGAQGVSGIRLLDGTNGWAFGPELWATHDGGKTWTQVNTSGQRVTDLETAGDRAFALWATCSGASSSFAADCTSYTLMTTTATSDTWTPVGSATTGLGDGGAATSAAIALTSTTGYLLAPDGAVYSGPLDGAWQQAGTAQCQPGAAQADGLPGGALLALVNSATLVVGCQAPGGAAITTSTDSGAAWSAQPAADWSGVGSIGTPTSLAAAPDGALLLATTSGMYVLPAGAGQWQQATAQNAPDGGFSYVGMTTDDQGVALSADASPHEIWMTFDGGQTWTPSTPITPGN